MAKYNISLVLETQAPVKESILIAYVQNMLNDSAPISAITLTDEIKSTGCTVRSVDEDFGP